MEKDLGKSLSLLGHNEMNDCLYDENQKLYIYLFAFFNLVYNIYYFLYFEWIYDFSFDLFNNF